jgi:hypothetical protein
LPSSRARLWLALGGGGVLFLLIAYLVSGPLIAGAQAKSQTQALQQTGTDMTKIDAFLSDTQVRDAKKTDAAAFKVAVDAYQAKLTDTDATLAADQDRLDAINRDIDFFGLFTPLESGTVHSNDGTIRHAKMALDAVAKGVAITRTELAFSSAFASAESNSESAAKSAKLNDLTSASISLQKAVADLDHCKLLDKDADVPPQYQPLVEAWSKVMTDVAGFADTARANDLNGVIAYLDRLVADSTVIYFDQSAFLAWYSAKFDPLEKAFRANAVAVPRYVVTTTKLV